MAHQALPPQRSNGQPQKQFQKFPRPTSLWRCAVNRNFVVLCCTKILKAISLNYHKTLLNESVSVLLQGFIFGVVLFFVEQHTARTSVLTVRNTKRVRKNHTLGSLLKWYVYGKFGWNRTSLADDGNGHRQPRVWLSGCVFVCTGKPCMHAASMPLPLPLEMLGK